jgi:hypothetical protein
MPEEAGRYRGGRPALPAPPVVVDVPDDPEVSGLLKLSELAGRDPPLSKFILEVAKPLLAAIPPPPKPSRSWAQAADAPDRMTTSERPRMVLRVVMTEPLVSWI